MCKPILGVLSISVHAECRDGVPYTYTKHAMFAVHVDQCLPAICHRVA